MGKSAEIRIVFNRFPELAAKMPGIVSEIVEKTAMVVVEGAQEELYEGHGVDTGALRASIKPTMTSALSAEVEPEGIEYAIPVEFGSVAHEIFPRNKKALAWEGGHPVKKVNHPGFAGLFYMTKGAERARTWFLAQMGMLEGKL
jgi:hypothetical protein